VILGGQLQRDTIEPRVFPALVVNNVTTMHEIEPGFAEAFGNHKFSTRRCGQAGSTGEVDYAQMNSGRFVKRFRNQPVSNKDKLLSSAVWHGKSLTTDPKTLCCVGLTHQLSRS
jgi:hypothetical protein